jgi:hypothetical protein
MSLQNLLQGPKNPWLISLFMPQSRLLTNWLLLEVLLHMMNFFLLSLVDSTPFGPFVTSILF